MKSPFINTLHRSFCACVLTIASLLPPAFAGNPAQQGSDYPPVTSRHLAVFVIDFPDATPAVRDSYPTTSELEDLLFDPAGRVATWLNAMSYGTFTLTGEVFGYFTHQNPGFVGGSIVELDGVLEITTINVPGFDINNYDGVVLLSVHDLGLAGARGTSGNFLTFDVNGSTISTSGVFAPFRVGSDCNCSLDPGSYIMPTGADASIEGVSTIDITRYGRTFVHEVIHYLGVSWHANSRTNGGSFDYEPEVSGNYGSGNSFPLINREYGNFFDAMGNGYYGASLISVFRDRVGWTNPGNRHSIKAYGQSMVTIQPINSTTGIRSVEIRIPYDYAEFPPRKNKGYFLEVRSGNNEWDNMLMHPQLQRNNDGIMVLKTDGANGQLMDMSPSPNFPFYGQTTSDIRDVVLKPGMFYENDQVRFDNVIANNDGSFTVDISVKTPTVIMATAVPTPGTISEAGALVTMTVTVDNVDTTSVSLTGLSHADYPDLDGVGSCALPQSIASGGQYECSFDLFTQGNAGFTPETIVATASGETASYTTAITITDALPSLAVTNTASPTVVSQSGDPATFTITVANNSVAADSVTLDSLDDDIYGNLDGQGTCSAPQIITSGSSYECSFTAAVNGAAGTVQTSTATATGADDEGNAAQAPGSAAVSIGALKPQPEVNLFVSASEGSEGEMTMITVTATAGSMVAGQQTVDVSVTGAGITTSDYTLTDGDAGQTGVQIVIPDGQTSGSIIFTVQDDVLPEGSESAALTISNPSSGIQLGATTTQDVTITDNDATPQVEANLTVNPVEASETDMTVVTIRALTNGNVTGEQTVELDVGGTGITAGDYILTDGDIGQAGIQIVIPDGTDSGSITFTVRDDETIEGEERAEFTISNPTAGIRLGPNPTQSVTISDNDGASLSVSDVTVDEDSGIARFDVTLTGSAPGFFTVDFASTDGSAIAGEDYTALSTSVGFNGANGESYGVDVLITDDNLLESDETFTVTLSNPTNGVLLEQAVGTATIVDNDGNSDLIMFADFEADTPR